MKWWIQGGQKTSPFLTTSTTPCMYIDANVHQNTLILGLYDFYTLQNKATYSALEGLYPLHSMLQLSMHLIIPFKMYQICFKSQILAIQYQDYFAYQYVLSVCSQLYSFFHNQMPYHWSFLQLAAFILQLTSQLASY